MLSYSEIKGQLMRRFRRFLYSRTVRRVRRFTLLALLSVIAALFLLEVALRLIAPQFDTFTHPDDELGWWFNASDNYTFIAGEGCPNWVSRGRTNSHGLIDDDDYAYERQPDTYRILMLGDSYTEALQHPDRNAIFPELLEARLNADSSTTRYEVLNAGRSASGTTVHYRYYLTEGQRYQPDLVMVMFIPNDFTDNSKAILPQPIPYYTLKGDELILDTSFRDDDGYRLRAQTDWMRQNFYFVTFLQQNLVAFSTRQAQQAAQSEQEAQRATDAASSTTTEFTTDEQAAVEITKRVMWELYQAAQVNGSEFVLVIGTHVVTVHPSHIAQNDEATMRDFEIGAYRIMRDFAQERGIPHLELTPILREWALENNQSPHGCPENRGYGHWSLAGHELVTDALYTYLSENGYLQE